VKHTGNIAVMHRTVLVCPFAHFVPLTPCYVHMLSVSLL